MTRDTTGLRGRDSGHHPFLRILAAFPVACFSGALATDIAYAFTANMIWADFSAWLLAVGMAVGVLAALAGLATLIARRRVLRSRPAWPVAIGSLAVLALACVDNLVHSRDAWTSVVPEGLALSALTVAAMLVTAWLVPVEIAAVPVVPYAGARP